MFWVFFAAMVLIVALAIAVIIMVSMASSAMTISGDGDWNRRFRRLETHLNGDADAPGFIKEFFERDEETEPETTESDDAGQLASSQGDQPMAA